MSKSGFAVRPVLSADLPAVLEVQRQVYGDAFQEDAAVFEAKLRLAPDAAWLAERDGRVVGYLFSHPWAGRIPPALHMPLAALPANDDCAYLHDLAVIPEGRGSGVAQELIDRFNRWACAREFGRSMLVAVGEAGRFWARLGFERASGGAASSEILSAYGPGAACMERYVVSRRLES